MTAHATAKKYGHEDVADIIEAKVVAPKPKTKEIKTKACTIS